ncbi:MAG: hypothetical protein AAFY05_08835 [Pseudomonadota bacterium]
MRQFFRDSENRQAIGIALFSATGSFPLHVAPLLIATLISSRTISNAEAAGLVSYIMAGQLLAAFLSTKIAFERLNRSALALAFAIYTGAILLTAWTTSMVLFAPAWFVTGLTSGFLMQLGIVTAAKSKIKMRAFAYRLSFALFFSGLIAFFLFLSGQNPGYGQLISIYLLVLLFVFLAGFLAWKNPTAHNAGTPANPATNLVALDVIGLAMLLLFFAGQIGFQANAVHFTSGNNMLLGDTALAIGMSKISISLVVLALAVRGGDNSWLKQFIYSFALAASAILISTQTTLLMLIIAFTSFELFINLTSAGFMASLSERLSERAKTRLLVATLLGVLGGPPLTGSLIDGSFYTLPIVLAVCSAFIPLLWQFYGRSAATTGRNRLVS